MSVKIKIENALKKYGDNIVISNLDLEIEKGEFFTLLGPSGCGKTTLLRMIAGFNSIEGGDFYFNEKRINDMDPGIRNIGMVFQNYAIFPHLSVKDNVSIALIPLGFNQKQIDEIVLKALELTNIQHKKDELVYNLSGGEKQRCAIARAIVNNPEIILCDEPTANLDYDNSIIFIESLRLLKSLNKTIIVATHDPIFDNLDFVDKIINIKNGTICE